MSKSDDGVFAPTDYASDSLVRSVIAVSSPATKLIAKNPRTCWALTRPDYFAAAA
jgi:hypothetical protein